MDNKTEGAIVIFAALLVLFSAVLDPKVSMIISLVALLALGVYHFTKKN